MEPIGNHAIHILVDHGQVTLVGVVDNEGDRTTATLEASAVPGVRKVVNDLQVEPEGEAG